MLSVSTTDVSEMRKTHGMRLTASDLVAIGLTQARYAMAMGNPARTPLGCTSPDRLRNRASLLNARCKPENISSTPGFCAARVRHQARSRLTATGRSWRIMEKIKNDQAYADRFEPCGRNPRGGDGRKPT